MYTTSTMGALLGSLRTTRNERDLLLGLLLPTDEEEVLTAAGGGREAERMERWIGGSSVAIGALEEIVDIERVWGEWNGRGEIVDG